MGPENVKSESMEKFLNGRSQKLITSKQIESSNKDN